MNCVRCGLFFDSSVPYINAESYGGNVIYACPQCGKAYQFKRVVIVDSCNDEEIEYKNRKDNWNHKIVLDKDYNHATKS